MALRLTLLTTLALLAAARKRYETCNENLSSHGACTSPLDVCRAQFYDNYSTCLPPSPTGGACNHSNDCAAGSSCSEHEGGLGTCGPAPALGEPCYPFGGPPCGRLAGCERPTPGAPGVCTRARTLGEACPNREVCEGEAVCSQEIPGGARLCRGFKDLNAFCIRDYECGPDAWCKGRMCVPLSKEGEACGWTWSCDGTLDCVRDDENDSDSRVCRPRPGAPTVGVTAHPDCEKD